MFILDCSTADNAIDSLCKCFSCSKDDIVDFLLSVDLDTIYAEIDSSPDVQADVYLYNIALERFGDPDEIEYVYWFHCTRTAPEENFSDGILPLGDSLERVFEIVLQTAPNNIVRERISEWGAENVPNYLYQLRVNESIHWGPYGILVKDVAFHTCTLGQHDSLGMPELIEDICKAYQDTYGVDIFSHYENVLSPKIVTFISDERCDNSCIKAALGYAYTSVRGMPPSGMAVTCIDCEGSTVSLEQIVNVETVYE